MTSTPTTDNPLLLPFTAPHGTAPFDRVRPDHYLPALHVAMTAGRREVRAIADNPAPPTFANTIVALEQSGALLGRVASVVHCLSSAETSPALQAVMREASPIETEYGNDILLNAGLFARVRAVFDQRDTLGLGPEDAMLLEKTYKRFARNGANLRPADKDRLRAIDRELGQTALQFGENNLNETNEYLLQITDERDLAGLPDFARDAARAMAVGKGKTGWVFSLQAPSYGPFMQYADSRPLREELYRAYGARGFQGNKNDNTTLIQHLISLRHERANLLGYATHADFVLEERMAGSAPNVQRFLDELVGHARPVAGQQLADLTAYARAQGFAEETLQQWDYSYYAERLKKERYDINDDRLKPYFKLDNVLHGAFAVANKLYGIRFREVTTIPVYHPDVRTFEVYDRDESFLAVFYGDYHPRPGKRAGAWMSAVQNQRIENGRNIRPHVMNVCNFTRPVVDTTVVDTTVVDTGGAEITPSLLTFYEVTTLFHEFGHGLHGMLANGQYESLTGTHVPWDFVELPSQLMENWCYEPEVLQLFARHYQTNELIPNELIEKIRASQRFLAGIATLRQLRLGLTDMYWHGRPPTGETVDEVERQVDARVPLLPRVPGTATSPSFSHIFSGGYSAGYYSYKWSEVLDADAFEYFQEQGGLAGAEAANAFRRHVLAAGGSEQPMTLYKKFRGREPAPTAMLRRSGLLNDDGPVFRS